MVFEIHTIGAGYYLEKVLYAVAFVLNDDGGFRIAMKIALLCAIFALALRATITSDLKQTVQWAISVTIFISLFFTTKATVSIIDRLPDKYGNTPAARVVKNVPWGLAAVGWATSSVGKTIAERFDAGFSLAFGNHAYTKTGLLFGSKIVEDMSKLRIANSEIKGLMLRFYRQCIVPDVNMGYARNNGYTVSDLKKAHNLVEFLKNHASRARLINITAKIKSQVPDTSTYGTLLGKTIVQETLVDGYVSCNKAIHHISEMLDYEMLGQIPNLASRFFSHFYPDTQVNQNKDALFASVLQDSYKIFIKDSKEAKDLLVQNVMINSIKDSVSSAYGKVSTEEMTRASFHSVSEIFQKFIPVLRAIFECLFYGVSPVIILLLMTPIGLEVLKNYGFGFIYLQLWLPMYSILFSITQHWARFSATGLDHLTLGTHSQIAAINADISMVSGYMLAMIPVLAIFITKGLVSSIGNMASSMMYIPQTAAVQTAEQSVKGNYSLGNTTIDTHAYDTLSAHKHDDNYHWSSGMKNFATTSGSDHITFADGRESVNIRTSDLGGLNLVSSNIVGTKIEDTETDLINKADRHAYSSSENIANGMSKIFGYDKRASQNESVVESLTKNLSHEDRQAFDKTKAFVDKLSRDHSLTKEGALKLAAMASTKTPFGGGSIEGSLTFSERAAYNDAREAFKDEKLSESFSKTQSIIESMSHQKQTSESKDLLDAVSADFKRSKQEDRSYTESIEELRSLQQIKARYQTQSTDVTQNFNNQFAEYAVKKYGAANFEHIALYEPVRAKAIANDFIKTLDLKDLVTIGAKDQFIKTMKNDNDVRRGTFTTQEVTAAEQKQKDEKGALVVKEKAPVDLTQLEDNPDKPGQKKGLAVIATKVSVLQNAHTEQKAKVADKIAAGQQAIDTKVQGLKDNKRDPKNPFSNTSFDKE